MISKLAKFGDSIKFMRDPTRGGVASTLNEVVTGMGYGVELYEDKIPIKEEVRGACELLGFDPLYVANEGKVVLKNKTAKNASVRIPQWVDKSKVKCLIGDEGIRPIWANQYIVITDLKPKDQVTITFPMLERTAKFTLNQKEYTVDFKGNTVVHIEPQGFFCPLYQRDDYRKNHAPMKNVQRFVSDVQIRW